MRPIIAALPVFLLLASPHASAAAAFERVVVDADSAGDCKAVGDMDGDGLPDLVVGGMPREKLAWYRNGRWERHVVAIPHSEFTTDCALGDIDGDGRLDVVVPDGDGRNNLVWFANTPSASPHVRWPIRVIGSVGDYGKDVELGDFDGDGHLDVAVRGRDQAMIFFQQSSGPWIKVAVPVQALGHEGMAMGDVDGDGWPDLVFQGAWVRNPGGHGARSAAWVEAVIGPAHGDFKAVVADLDGDGRADVVFSSSEGTADVTWWRQGDPGQPWQAQVISAQVDRAHTLQAADMDGDGHLDVVVGQMGSSREKELAVYLNTNGDGSVWRRLPVDAVGLHNGIVADIDKDGAPDIVGSDHTGRPPLLLWLNRLPGGGQRSDAVWRRIGIGRHHVATFGLAVGDFDGDGDKDIASGPFLYHNPGGGLTRPWRESRLPGGWTAFAAMDVEGRDRLNLLVRRPERDTTVLAWMEPRAGWAVHPLGAVPASSHREGGQGWSIIRPGGGALAVPAGDALAVPAGGALVVSDGGGIHAFRRPADPHGPWSRILVSDRPSDEGLAVADIDRDGWLDVVATTGQGKQVEWYRNPGRWQDHWSANAIGAMPEAVFPDRVAVADLDGDGRLDVVVSEENGAGAGAVTFWWSQPADPSAPWSRRLLAVQGSTNSMTIADLDGDRHPDVVTAEHRGLHRQIAWMNDGKATFIPREIDRGIELHLGALAADLDGDGDLDLVGIGWDHPEHLWLWRQDRRGGGASAFTWRP